MDLAHSPLPMVISVILCSLIHCPWEDWYVLIWAFGSNARFKNNLLGNVELSWKSGFVPRHHFLVLLYLTCFEAYTTAVPGTQQDKIFCQSASHSA